MDEAKPKKVFCVGLQKTGTKSMNAALDRLGYRVCSFFGVNDPPEVWRREAFRRAWEYDAFEDHPWPFLYREMDASFPGSKFILTIRDLEDWYDSCHRHFQDRSMPMQEWLYGPGRGAPAGNKDAWVERHRRHLREVRAHFAGRSDDLLELSIVSGDGWEPLCEFLGRDVPGVPFPHENEGRPWWRVRAGQIKSRILGMWLEREST